MVSKTPSIGFYPVDKIPCKGLSSLEQCQNPRCLSSPVTPALEVGGRDKWIFINLACQLSLNIKLLVSKKPYLIAIRQMVIEKDTHILLCPPTTIPWAQASTHPYTCVTYTICKVNVKLCHYDHCCFLEKIKTWWFYF